MAGINSSPSAEITHIPPLTSVSEPQDSHITEIPLEDHGTQPVGLNCCSKCIIFFYYVLQLLIFSVVGTFVSPVILPCLLVLFVVVRFLQLITHGEAYDNVTLLKVCIRSSLFMNYSSILPALFAFMKFEFDDLILMANLFVLLLCFFISTLFLVFLPRVQLDPLGSVFNFPEAVSEIAECMIVFSCVYILKLDDVLGFEILKWTTRLLIIVSIYNFIRLFTHLFARLLKKFFHDNLQHSNNGNNNSTPDDNYSLLEILLHKKSLVYWANGLQHNATFLLSSSVFLLAWVLFFGHKLNGTPKAKHFFVFGTRTCLSFITCAFLWFIKRCILLSREAESICDRLESKILQGGKHLYFLGVLGRHKYDMFKLLYDKIHRRSIWDEANRSIWSKVTWDIKNLILLRLGVDMNYDTEDEWISGKNLSKFRMKNAKEYLLINGTPTTFGIQQAASYFLMAHNKLLEDNYTDVLLETLQSYNQDNDNHEIRGGITEDILKQIIGEDTWSDFQLLLN